MVLYFNACEQDALVRRSYGGNLTLIEPEK